MTGPSFAELLQGRVTTPVADRLARYGELLEKWSRTHNLVRVASRQELVDRHLLEALAARDLLEERGRLVDVGSGAGLPGVPLLAACEGWQGVLVEPRAKRWAFLCQVIRELELDATAERCRYSELASELGPFDVVTARAVGGTRELLDWARGFLTRRGSVLVWSTEDEVEDLQDLRDWRVVSCGLPRLERGRLIQIRQCFT